MCSYLNIGQFDQHRSSKGIDDPIAVPDIVVKNHGSFSWNKNTAISVYYTVCNGCGCQDISDDIDGKPQSYNGSVGIKKKICEKQWTNA